MNPRYKLTDLIDFKNKKQVAKEIVRLILIVLFFLGYIMYMAYIATS